MGETLSAFTSFEAMKAEDYVYWQSRPVYERIDAVSALTLAAYAMKEPFARCSPISRNCYSPFTNTILNI
jgi:hypothetical protein